MELCTLYRVHKMYCVSYKTYGVRENCLAGTSNEKLDLLLVKNFIKILFTVNIMNEHKQ